MDDGSLALRWGLPADDRAAVRRLVAYVQERRRRAAGDPGKGRVCRELLAKLLPYLGETPDADSVALG